VAGVASVPRTVNAGSPAPRSTTKVRLTTIHSVSRARRHLRRMTLPAVITPLLAQRGTRPDGRCHSRRQGMGRPARIVAARPGSAGGSGSRWRWRWDWAARLAAGCDVGRAAWDQAPARPRAAPAYRDGG